MDTEIFEDIINQAYSEDQMGRGDLFPLCEKAYLMGQTSPGAEVPCSAGLSDLRTDFAIYAIKDAKNKIHGRIQAYEKGESALTAEQYEDYKHDAYVLFKAMGR